jgi:hypothetical protein
LISYKTSNNQSEIEKMPYYVFNNFVAFLNEIIEEENGDNKNSNQTTEASEHIASAQKNFKTQMSSMSKNFGKIGSKKI